MSKQLCHSGFYDEGGWVYQPRYIHLCQGPNSPPEGSGLLLRRYEGCIWTPYRVDIKPWGYESFAWEGERLPLKGIGKDWFCNCPERIAGKYAWGHSNLCEPCYDKYKKFVKEYNALLPFVDSIKLLKKLGFKYV